MDHRTTIHQQFTWQAVNFSNEPSMSDPDAIQLLITASHAGPQDRCLDVACGPGLVALGFASAVREVIGLDTTQAMLDRAQELQQQRDIANVAWMLGEADALPFDSNFFDIVTCRYAFHHMLEPARALREMHRVIRPGGRIVVCDAVASDDSDKARAFNEFERMRDPSTVRFLDLAELHALFAAEGLTIASQHSYRVKTRLDALIGTSFPAPENVERLEAIGEASLRVDALGMNTRRRGQHILLDYNTVAVCAETN